MGSSLTHHNGRSSKCQTEQHQDRNSLLGRFNVWHTQTSIITAESGMYRLEDVREFKKIETDNRRGQYGQLRKKRELLFLKKKTMHIFKLYLESVYINSELRC